MSNMNSEKPSPDVPVGQVTFAQDRPIAAATQAMRTDANTMAAKWRCSVVNLIFRN
jgi:hypothetical protein